MRDRRRIIFRTGLFLLLAAPLAAAISEEHRRQIDKATGVSGSYNAAEDVYRVAFPRTDVKVTVEGRSMHPFLGLTSWAAFTPHNATELMVMGDLVLFEDEVNPVMSAVLDNGIEVTALHNHFFFDSPRVMFMHIGGSGLPSVSRPRWVGPWKKYGRFAKPIHNQREYFPVPRSRRRTPSQHR